MVSKALFDQDAFYSFRALIQGGLAEPQQLLEIERFLRALVLHDEMTMELEPHPAPASEEDEPEWTEEEIAQGGRNVIVAFGPVLTDYEGLLGQGFGPDQGDWQELTLSPRLEEIAAACSPADPNDAYHKAHRKHLRRLASVLATGGSVVCQGPVGRAAFESQAALPQTLFAELDREWGEYAQAAQDGLDFAVPPVLAIVLSRANGRQNLLPIIRDLRDEWAQPRKKVWEIVARLRAPSSVKEAYEARRELLDAAKLLKPTQDMPGSLLSLRLLWDVFAPAAVGAAMGGMEVAAVAAASSAIVKGTMEAAMRQVPDAGKYFLRRGALDLARRINVELRGLEPLRALLARHLTEAERRRLEL